MLNTTVTVLLIGSVSKNPEVNPECNTFLYEGLETDNTHMITNHAILIFYEQLSKDTGDSNLSTALTQRLTFTHC